ncbi:glycoside hydrolase superfamily [Mycena leptocephala]|nr:glycoside hydrolase superfamily [Mycena leptocephala]
MHISRLLLLLGAAGIQLAAAIPISDLDSDPTIQGSEVASTDLSPNPTDAFTSAPPSGTDDPSTSTTPDGIDPPDTSTDDNSMPGSSATTASDPGPSSAPGMVSQNSTSTMEPPYFVIYAIDNSEDPNVQGPPPVENLTGFNVVALAFLVSDGAPTPSSQADQWQQMDASKRADVKASYAQAGIKLIVSVGGETEHPTTDGRDAKDTASKVAQWVKDYDLDGVDVDYEASLIFASHRYIGSYDFDAMTAGTGEQWRLQDGKLHWLFLANRLLKGSIIRFAAPRSDLPGGGYRTIHNAVGSMINWFYNAPGEDTTCDNLLNQANSTYDAETSVFEINTNAQVPLEKIVIGKPATAADAESGYMDPTTLATCIEEAAGKNWTAGIMFWKYSDDASGIMQQARGQAFPLSSAS